MVNMEFYTYLNHKRNMDLPSQIHSFIVKRIYNITFLVKALLFALFVSLNSAYAQETTSYNLTNESNAGLLKRAELLIDTDVITSIELSKSLLSQAQSADDTLLSAKLHNLLGRANKKNNNINESLEHFLQSSVYYSKLNDSRNQIKASINYINILLEEKRYDELTTRIETLLPTTLVYGDDFFIAQVLLTKGDSFYEQKKYNNANAQYTSALKYLVDEDELIQRQLGETYKKLAQSYKRLKNREQTAHFYTKALEVYSNLGDLKLMARTLNTLAEAHRYLDNLVLALDYSTRALEIHKDIDDPVGFAKALLGAGIIYRHINLYEKSLEHINEAYLYYKKVNNMLGIAKTSNQMGLVYTRLRQFDQAEFFYQITIDLPKGMVEEKTLASALREMAVINLESGDLASAMQYAKKAYITYKNKNLTSYISTTARIIGNIYRAQGNNNKAIEYYKESLSFARETGGKLYEIKSLTALAGILIGIDTNEAISLLKRSLALSPK